MKYMFLSKVFAIVFMLNGCNLESKKEESVQSFYSASQEEQIFLDEYLEKSIRFLELHEELYISTGRKLSSEELDLARKMDIKYPEKIRVAVVEEFPLPEDEILREKFISFGFNSPETLGRNYGYAVTLKPRAKSNLSVLSHEFVHVAQVERTDRRHWVERYLVEILRFGYFGAPLEIEAYEKQIK